MLDIQGGVYSRLIADATLLALLNPFESGPGVAAVPTRPEFTFEAVKPRVLIDVPTLNESDDTFTSSGRDVQINIRLYHTPKGTTLPLDQAAERVRDVLKYWTGSIAGGQVTGATVAGPVQAPVSDPAFEGRLLIVRLTIEET